MWERAVRAACRLGKWPEQCLAASRWPFVAGVLAVVLAALLHGALAVQPHAVEETDSPEWLQMSLNAAVHGTLSYDDHRSSTVTPTRNRPPLYSYLASFAIAAGSDPGVHDADCVRKQSEPGCRAVIRSVQLFNLLLFALLASVTALLGWLLGGVRVGLASGFLVAGNTFFASYVAIVCPEILAALLVAVASLFLVLCFRHPASWRRWMLAGASLGILALTKPVFTYALVFLPLVASLGWRWRSPSTPHERGLGARIAPVAVALALAASFPCAWIVRNVLVFDESSLALDEQGAGVLATRAAYTTLAWREVLPLALSRTPTIGEPLVKRLFPPADVRRVLPVPGRNRDTFYVDHKAIVMDAAATLDPALKDASDIARAKAVILANFGKQLALVPVFVYSGLFPHTGSGAYKALMSGIMPKPIMAVLLGVSIAALTAAMIALLAAPVLVLMRQASIVWFAATALPLYSIAFHAGLTHYIGRYSNQVVPVGFVVLAAGLFWIWDRWRGPPIRTRRSGA